MATYKMKSTQKGVLPGAVHPVTFEAGKTYEIGDDLAGQFQALDAIEESSEEPVAPTADETRTDLHENWLDTNPAVLRHGELTAAEVVARDESTDPETTNPADQVVGKAEGEENADESGDESGDKASKAKKAK